MISPRDLGYCPLEWSRSSSAARRRKIRPLGRAIARQLEAELGQGISRKSGLKVPQTPPNTPYILGAPRVDEENSANLVICSSP